MVGLKNLKEKLFSRFQLAVEKIPNDFDPNSNCLFCINRQECSHGHQPPTNLSLNNYTHPNEANDDDENYPLDLSLKTTSNSK